MITIDLILTFFIAFIAASSTTITAAFIAGATAALAMYFSQKLKYIGSFLITIQGAFISIILAMEFVSPYTHPKIDTWITALIIFVIYMLLNGNAFYYNINWNTIDIIAIIKNKTTKKSAYKQKTDYRHQYQHYNERTCHKDYQQAINQQPKDDAHSYFQNCSSMSELTKTYRKWAKQLHPDNGGNAEMFTEMMNEYQQLRNCFS